jgi:hypothetical protein
MSDFFAEKKYILSKITDIKWDLIPLSLKLFWVEQYRKEKNQCKNKSL